MLSLSGNVQLVTNNNKIESDSIVIKLKMIEAFSITKTVNNKKLFNNISLTIENKSITGLLGANGAGKTSLFRAIAGLSKINTGKLMFLGQDVTDLSLEERSKLGLSYVPQENSLFEELSLNRKY